MRESERRARENAARGKTYGVGNRETERVRGGRVRVAFPESR